MRLNYMVFKGLRKVNSLFGKITTKLKVYSYQVLSNGRFSFQSPYFIGSNFSVNTDLTDTVIKVGENFRVRNQFNITIGKKGVLSIGNDCFFNNNCSINCLGNIDIGNNNQFGEGVLIYDHNHQFKDKSVLISEQEYTIGTIKIGNNCWIGSHVVILKDVTIGDNVVIGAGCVIHKSISSDSLVVNNQDLLHSK